MMTRKLAVTSCLVLAFSGLATVCSAEPQTQPAVSQLEAAPYTLVGPFVHENLAVYLVQGHDVMNGRHYLTLQEALDQKAVIVHETGDVNELSIENVSADKDVFVESGDIVKGGRQDRTIAQDFICAPKSGKVPIDAFCVEHGRWQQRGQEQAAVFGSSINAVAGKSLKLAARQKANQGEVWQQVSQNQAKLSQNAAASVADAQSETSYELTLENKKVDENVAGYVSDLQKQIEGRPEVIGYAFAINGKVNSAEIYGSHELFVKLWPKLLRSSAVEAFAELEKGKTFDAPPLKTLSACMADAGKAKAEAKDLTPRVELVTQETKDNVLFETRDREAKQGWVHRSYLTQDAPSESPQRQRRGVDDINSEQTNAPATRPSLPRQQEQNVQQQTQQQ